MYTLEFSPSTVDICPRILSFLYGGRNGVADRVTVINKSSAALEPGVDLPAKGVDVIVTELVDSGLLGERIIPVLCDARARGLLAEGGQVVPEVCTYVRSCAPATWRRHSSLPCLPRMSQYLFRKPRLYRA